MSSLQENIDLIYTLLGKSPYECYVCTYTVECLSVRRKLSIVAACLNDQNNIIHENCDPKDRDRVIKKCAKDFEKLAANKRIKEMVNEGLL